MTKPTIDPLQKARRIAQSAGLFFVEKGSEYRVFRKTGERPVFLGKRTSAQGLCSFVSRCAAAK